MENTVLHLQYITLVHSLTLSSLSLYSLRRGQHAAAGRRQPLHPGMRCTMYIVALLACVKLPPSPQAGPSLEPLLRPQNFGHWMPSHAGCSLRSRNTERSLATRFRRKLVAAAAVSLASGDGSSHALEITSSDACTAPVATREATALRSHVERLSSSSIACCCTLSAGWPRRLDVAKSAARSRRKAVRGPAQPSQSPRAKSTARAVTFSPAPAEPAAATKRAMLLKRSCSGPSSSSVDCIRLRCSTAPCSTRSSRGARAESSSLVGCAASSSSRLSITSMHAVGSGSAGTRLGSASTRSRSRPALLPPSSQRAPRSVRTAHRASDAASPSMLGHIERGAGERARVGVGEPRAQSCQGRRVPAIVAAPGVALAEAAEAPRRSLARDAGARCGWRPWGVGRRRQRGRNPTGHGASRGGAGYRGCEAQATESARARAATVAEAFAVGGCGILCESGVSSDSHAASAADIGRNRPLLRGKLLELPSPLDASAGPFASAGGTGCLPDCPPRPSVRAPVGPAGSAVCVRDMP
eukprot:scaffold221_cov122-Isochrysis_galbana.AAC.7